MLLCFAVTVRSPPNEYPVASKKHQKSLMPHWMLHLGDDDGSSNGNSHAPQLDLNFRARTRHYSTEEGLGASIMKFINKIKCFK